MKCEELAVLKAVAICYKPFLKPEEAMIYCNLEHSQLAKRTAEYGVYKTATGYFEREELNRMMAGQLLTDGSRKPVELRKDIKEL